ncbi:DUF6485 family protein [Acidobacteriota bacterium]
MRKTCDQKKNLDRCTCTYDPCQKKGLCCECIEYHWRSQDLPGCLFPPETERTYDRSLDTFLKAWAEKKGYRLEPK